MVSWMVHQEITYNDLPISFGKPPSIAAKVLSRNCFQDLQENARKVHENSNIPPIYYYESCSAISSSWGPGVWCNMTQGIWHLCPPAWRTQYSADVLMRSCWHRHSSKTSCKRSSWGRAATIEMICKTLGNFDFDTMFRLCFRDA